MISTKISIIMKKTMSRLVDYIKVNLPQSLKNHINRTCKIGEDLSELNNVDLNKVTIALLGHDLYRAYNNKELLREAGKNYIYISEVEKHSPILLHGKLASLKMKKVFKIFDNEILHSIKWHTSAHKYMSKIFKIVFLSDKIEPFKVNNRPELNEVKKLALDNLDKSIIKYFDIQFDYFESRKIQIHPESIKFYESLI